MFSRNNLDNTASPYLLQHRDNPIWWQPWTEKTLAYARETGKPIFVSVGYATCHWCHVMAREAFSHEEIAAALNDGFVSIKVDREERPDIDHFLMQFLMATRGHGGWPLNAFLTPDLRPMLALTYVPVAPRGGMPAMGTILEKVMEYYTTEGHRPNHLDLWKAVEKERRRSENRTAEEQNLTVGQQALQRGANLIRRADRQYGGFGQDTKFPPHSSLLYLLYLREIYTPEATASIDAVLHQTLRAMAQYGLHDHLQGGFFRYCVDRQWQIPHFEKMLYDQAMMLWVYSVAGKVLEDPWYHQVARGVVRCLEESFRTGGCYLSAHDADTDHIEGDTYLFDDEEIPRELQNFFHLAPGGNMEGRHHLVRRDSGPVPPEVQRHLDTLLQHRRTRRPPDTDRKVVTAWNALAGTALLNAARFLNAPHLTDRARELYHALKEANSRGPGHWIRSSLDGVENPTECLEDYGAVLLFITTLVEEASSREERQNLLHEAALVRERLDAFATPEGWRYTLADDIPSIPADTFDSPSPSPVALAEQGLYRLALLTGTPATHVPFYEDTYRDFANITALMAGGEFYLLEERDGHRPWGELPANVIRTAADQDTWCFRGVCHPGWPQRWNPPPDDPSGL